MLKIPSIVGPSNIEGVGVFATSDVRKGGEVWSFDERVDFRRTDFPDWLKKYTFTDSKGVAMDGDNARFMNHSDAPNLISSEGSLIAAVDILAWEELTVNYNDPESKCAL